MYLWNIKVKIILRDGIVIWSCYNKHSYYKISTVICLPFTNSFQNNYNKFWQPCKHVCKGSRPICFGSMRTCTRCNILSVTIAWHSGGICLFEKWYLLLNWVNFIVNVIYEMYKLRYWKQQSRSIHFTVYGEKCMSMVTPERWVLGWRTSTVSFVTTFLLIFKLVQ